MSSITYEPTGLERGVVSTLKSRSMHCVKIFDENFHRITKSVEKPVLRDLEAQRWSSKVSSHSKLTHAVSPPTGGCSSMRKREYDGAISD